MVSNTKGLIAIDSLFVVSQFAQNVVARISAEIKLSELTSYIAVLYP
tara:strand:+ start:99 stop:239 length:141 start_codon:yes stop_codon:yes gene_type:complete